MVLLEFLRKNLSFLIFNLVVVLGFIGLLEGICAYYLRNPSSIPPSLISVFAEYYRTNDRNIVQVTDCGQYDPDLFYTLAPGECVFENREFSTKIYSNSEGIRDDEASLDDPEVVVIGDSFSMGWGVEQQECYAHLLESMLNGKKTLNASISSYGTARETILLDHLGVTAPEWLIIQYHPTDFSENMEFVANDYQLKISPESTYDSLRSYIQSRTKYFPGKHLAHLLKLKLQESISTPQEVSVNQEVDAFLEVLLHSKLNLDSTRIIVFEVDHISALNNDFIGALKQEISNRDDLPAFIKNISIIMLKDVMSAEDFFILDEHLNATGHKHLASVLSKFIQSHHTVNL